jgi:hypothetical protein
MASDRKCVIANFQALAEEFGSMISLVPQRAAEDIALDYHDAAQRAGALLDEACRAGLLAKVPGLVKLVDRGMDAARLFRQFHGYEVNAAVLLPRRSRKPGPGSAALTCGLLPQLLPNHPVFGQREVRDHNPDQQAILAELQRAQAACDFLAAQVAPVPKIRSAKKPTTKPIADFAEKLRKRTPGIAWKEIAQRWLSKHPGATGDDGAPLTWRHAYYAWRKHYGNPSPKRTKRPRA